MEEAVTRSTLIRLPPQELVGTFPRGEGKAFMFSTIKKLICISMFLDLGERETHLTSCLPLGEGGTPQA